jgi:hypothetical protein
MVNQNQKNQKNNLAANLFLFNTAFMLFTKEFSGTMGMDLSATSFNVIQINEDIRSNIFYVVNNLIFCVFFYRQKEYLLRLAFWIAVAKFIYKFGMLVGVYEFNKGYSDFLSIAIMVLFMIFDKIKWKFRSGIFL